MATPEYKCKGRTWRPCSTVQDENSLFHAAFGCQKSGRPYEDTDVKKRRERWIQMLKHFVRNVRPPCVVDMNKALFSTCSDAEYNGYVDKVSQPDYRIVLEDIPFISTLENVKITVFTDEQTPPTTTEPNQELSASYPRLPKNKLTESVVLYDGFKFSRLDPIKNKYPKLPGSGGIKGGLYQVNLLTIFLLNGLLKRRSWRLSTENAEAGKFDDVVFEDTLSGDAILLQAKQRENASKAVTYKELFHTHTKTDAAAITTSIDTNKVFTVLGLLLELVPLPMPILLPLLVLAPPLVLLLAQMLITDGAADARVGGGKDHFSLPKYFCSYQQIKTKFRIGSAVICTNVDLSGVSDIVERESLPQDHLLYHEDEQSVCYKFNDSSLPVLERSLEEFSTNTRHKLSYTEQDVSEFLKRFRIIARYSGDLEEVIEKLITKMGYCNRFESKDHARYVIKKMMEWFEARTGTYLTAANAEAMFSEIRSNKFCETLHKCNIIVKDTSFVMTKRILVVVSQRGYILNMIRIYYALHGKCKSLFVNPGDDVEVQKQVVDAYQVPHYDLLVVFFAESQQDAIRHMCGKINGILNNFEHKKLIVISANEELASEIEDEYADAYEKVHEDITFDNLTEDSQKTVEEKMILFFHAKLR